MKEYLAKSDGTTLLAHTRAVVAAVRTVLENFPGMNKEIQESCIRAAIFHDLGKVADDCQKVLRSNIGEAPHALASCQISMLADQAYEVQYAVRWHHAKGGEIHLTPENLAGAMEIASTVLQENGMSPVAVPCNLEAPTVSCSYFRKSCSTNDVKAMAKEMMIACILRYADWIASGADLPLSFVKTRTAVPVEPAADDRRTKAQIEVADQIQGDLISHINMDAGGGKTRLGLMWARRQVVWMLPKVAWIDNMVQTIQGDLDACGLDLSTQSVYGGKVQSGSGLPFEADIVVTTPDRVLIDTIDQTQKSVPELLRILAADLVIDESHEYIHLDKMLIPLKILLAMKALVRTRTLMLSGTPSYGLLDFLSDTAVGGIKIPDCSKFVPAHSKKYFFHKCDAPTAVEPKALYYFNKIADAQNLFKLSQEEARISDKFNKEDGV